MWSNIRIKGILFFIFFVFISQTSKSQTIDWTDYVVLFQDNDVKVEISFYLSKNACDPNNGKPIKYRYQVSGRLDNRDKFLIWKVIYKNCSGSLNYEYINLPLGGSSAEKLYVGGLNVINNLGESLDNISVTNSADYQILGTELKTQFTDVHIGKVPNNDKGKYRLKKSTEPNTIVGPVLAKYNTDVTLTLDGGELGENADWFWYKDNCGGSGSTFLGNGPTLTLNKVSDDVKIFVRAESNTGNTNCVSYDLKVNTKSSPPTGINASDDLICEGTSVKLNVEGGELGKDAKWVWRILNENGESIGDGPDITVYPLKRTTYYVRAESSKGNSASWSKTIDVIANSELPTKINVTYNSLKCEGSDVKLYIADGKLGYQSNWAWYSGNCGQGIKLGTGESINIKPSNNQNYYLMSDGKCKSLNCVNYKFTDLSGISIKPNYISTFPASIIKKKRFTLEQKGGYLGTNAQWYWYKETQGVLGQVGELIGVGPSISTKIKSTTKFYVIAKGDCGETSQIPITVYPNAKSNSSAYSMFTTNGTRKKHLALGLGFDFNKLYQGDSLSGVGGYFKAEYHPFFSEYFQLGLMGEFRLGKGEEVGADSTISVGYYDDYYQYGYGLEIAAGSRPIKLLARYHQVAGQYMNYNDKGQFRMDYGIRIGRMEKRSVVDLYYIISNPHPIANMYTADDFLISNSSAVGFGITWWRLNRFKLFFESMDSADNYSSSSTSASTEISTQNFMFYFGFGLNLDRFYSK